MQKSYGVSKEDIAMALESQNPVNSIYDSTFSDGEDGNSIIEKISSNIDEQNLITNKIAISQLLENLKQDEKEVILLRYFKEKTQVEIARIIGTSQVQVSRIEKKALENMKRKLTKDVVMK